MLLVAWVVCACTGGRAPASPTLGADAAALSLAVPRAAHRATTLDDGRVLITGGCTQPGCGGFEEGRASELFDPAAGRFRPGPRMVAARASGTATLLSDGRVLLTGGYPGEGLAAQSSAEVYDPTTDSFRAVGSMTTARADHTATVQSDGRLLLAGGTGADGAPLASTEVFDPATGTSTSGPPMPGARTTHAAVTVGADVVLIGGTADLVAGLAGTVVLHDGTWTAGPTLQVARVKHAAVRLTDEQVLVIGGSTDIEGTERLASTEVLDVRTGASSAGPDLSEPQYKLDGAVVELPDHRIVIAGGQRLEVYDPRSRRLRPVDEPIRPRRSFVSASVLGADRVLVAGGYDDRITPTADARIVRLTQ